MSILFIADVHLSHDKPKIVNGFLNFLNNQAIKARALYILGDLFESWLGDDDQNLLHIDIAQGLKALQEKKIPCYFIHGNHDFLLGLEYANKCGMILLPNQKIIQLISGKKIVILHGDTLCTDDKKYLKMKKIFDYYILQKIFLSLPFTFRLYIYNFIYTYCNKHKPYKLKTQLNINNQIVIDMLIQSKVKIMIHGHTHQPAIHDIYYSKYIIFKRIVLGCWDECNGSVVKINEENNTISLIKFSLNINKNNAIKTNKDL